MKSRCNISTPIFALLIALSTLTDAQQALSNHRPTPSRKLRVELKTNKHKYGVGEPVRVTVLLQNRGTSPVYVAKSFSWAGLGVAGFSVSVEQLTGRKSNIGCGIAGTGFSGVDSRTPEEVLRDDYLRLPPGGVVGFEDQYRGCTVMHPGIYKITAIYYAQDLHIDKVRFVAEKAEEIVTGQVRSEPSTFRVRDFVNKLRD